MPVFNADLSNVSSSFDVLPKGDYEFIVGQPKAFLRQAGEDKHDSYGIRYPLRVANPERYAKSKPQPYSVYMQNEGGQSYGKGFVMACLGYGKGRKEEDRFDADMGGKDWTFDTDSGEVGEVWNLAADSRVIGSLDVTTNKKDGSEQQQFTGWRTVTSGPLT